MDMKNIIPDEYLNKVKDYKYFRIIKKIIKTLSGNNKTILDVGSFHIDLMSEYPFKKRVSVSLEGAVNNDKVAGYEMDFFDFDVPEKFDVVTCLQVVEHVTEAKEFVQKVLKSGKICIISVPYKWKKGACKYHVQDPVDEKKMFTWAERKPVFKFIIKDGSRRMILIYGKLNFVDYLKFLSISVCSNIGEFCRNKLFLAEKIKSGSKWYNVVHIMGIKMAFRDKKKEMAESNKKMAESNKKMKENLKKITDKFEQLEKTINVINKKLEKANISDFEIKRCLEFKEQIQQIDLESNYKNLIKNLDKDSVNTVCTILSRILRIKPDAAYSKETFFSHEELEILDKIKYSLKNKIVKLSDNCYAYKNYYLPGSYFDTSVFYYRYGLDLLKNTADIKDKCIIDAGAFIGDSALILEPYCDKVYAFEPTTSNYNLLLKTIELNDKSSKIIPVKKGLGAKEETLNIHIDKGSSSINRVLRDNLETEPIEITTLDKFVEENNLQVGLIKVDIEGAEQDFLKGAINTIKTQKPILLLSIYHSAFDFFQIKPIIEDLNLGYDLKISKGVDESIRGEILLIAQ